MTYLESRSRAAVFDFDALGRSVGSYELSRRGKSNSRRVVDREAYLRSR